jgi:hypothetical protein
MAIQLDGSVKLVHLSTTPGLTDSKQILMFVKHASAAWKVLLTVGIV